MVEQRADEQRKMLEDGIRLHMQGNLGAATDVYRSVLAGNPRNADALNLLGAAHLQAGDAQLAARLIRDAIAIDDRNPGFFNNLGQALYAAGDLVGAEENYRRALAGRADDPGIFNNLGIVLNDMGRLAESEAAYRAALDLDDDDPEIHHNHGVLLQAMGRLAEAVEAYGRALALNPRMENTHTSLGAAFVDLGDREAATRAYMTAIEINPLHVDAHEGLKRMRWDSGEPERMDDSYYHACRLLPRSSEAHANLGKALIDSNKLEEAEKALTRAIALDPGNAEAHSQLGRAHTARRRFDQAVAEHRRAIRLDGNNALFREELGETLLRAGEFGVAVDALRAAHDLNPRRSSVLADLTIAMNEVGDRRVDGLVDYDRFVTTRLIELPDGFPDLDAFNGALHAELAKMHAKRPPPMAQTMRGGTQIPNNLFSNPGGLVAVVKQKIAKALADYIGGLARDPDHPFLRYANPRFRFTGAWSTIIYGTGYDESHIHNEGWISGVYYVQVPDLPEDRWRAGEGCLQVGAPPKLFVSEKNKTRRLIRPRVGMAVFFPSYYWHGVRPFGQEGLRHSIAFDVI